MKQDQLTIQEYVRVNARITVFEALELVGQDAEDDLKQMVADGILSKKDKLYILAKKKPTKNQSPELFK